MNKILLIVVGIVVLIALIIGVVMFGSYNGLVTKQQNVKAHWSELENSDASGRRGDVYINTGRQ